jgi:cytoskeletal protein CcmA (bactofilin family)
MSVRVTRLLILLVVATVAVSTVPGLAAAETRAGGSVVVDADETTGDLEVFGGDVTIRGTVDGDLRAFGGNVRIEGTVTGDVEAAAGNLYISGTVGGNVQTGSGNVQLTESASIDGTLEAGAGTVILAGSVGGNAKVGAETVTLAPTATIGGSLEYDGTLDRADGAQVGGAVTRNPDLSIGGPIPQVPELFFSVYFLAVNFLVGAILLLAFPGFSRGLVERTRERPGVTGVVGLGGLIATPVVLVLIAITIVGIPLSLVGLFVYLIGIWLGIVYGRYLLGTWLLSLVDYENRWLALLVGLLVMAGTTRIPVVGGFADLAVLVWGLGALAMGVFATYRNRRSGGETAEGDGPANAGTAAEST